MEKIQKISDNDLEEISGGTCQLTHYRDMSGKDCWYVSPDTHLESIKGGVKIHKRGESLGPYNTFEEAIDGAHKDNRQVCGYGATWVLTNVEHEELQRQYDAEKEEVFKYLRSVGDLSY